MVSNIEHKSPLGKSDHSVLLFDVNCYTENLNSDKVSVKYDKGDYKSINEYLARDWKKSSRT